MTKHIEIKLEDFAKAVKQIAAQAPTTQYTLDWGLNEGAAIGFGDHYYNYQLYDVIQGMKSEHGIRFSVRMEEPNERLNKYLHELDKLMGVGEKLNAQGSNFVLTDIWVENNDEDVDVSFQGMPACSTVLLKYELQSSDSS